jgi:DNA-binding MarR family transcriptional regulator
MVNHIGTRDEAVERLFTSMVAFARRFRATGQRWSQPAPDLTPSEVGILQVIADEGGCRAGTVAARLCTSPSVVSRQVVTLADQDLLERRRDPADGRAELLSLTPRGAETLAAMRRAYLSGLGGQLTDWDVDRLRTAADLVDQLTDLLALAPHQPPVKEPA